MNHSYADEAIRLAMQGRWEDAVAMNESIIEISPNDVEARNRLGKALAELGRYSEAVKAYERVAEISPHNNIARRNIQRLSHLRNGEPASKESRGIDSRFFIEDTSKARMVNLRKLAPRETLAKVSAGDQVYLQIGGQKLGVVDDAGDYLGEIEPRIGSRLIDLIDGGNEYQAVVISLRDDEVRLIIRETYRHPGQAGRPSFPPRAAEEMKPYLKNTLVKYDLDEELFEGPDEPGDIGSEAEPSWDDDDDDDDGTHSDDRESVPIGEDAESVG